MLNRWRDLDRKIGLPLLRLWVEQVLLGPATTTLTRILFARRLALIETHFDRDFYLRQLRPHWSRRAARRDAALHYHLVGRLHRCWPHPDFDPVAYHNDHPHLTWADDPLIDHVKTAGSSATPHRRRAPVYEASETVVVLHHARGGGSDHYLDLMEQRLRANGVRVVRLVRLGQTAPLFRATDRNTDEPLSPVFDLTAEPDALGALLEAVGAGRVIVNHAVDLVPEDLSHIVATCDRAKVPFEVHLHDYLFLCPRINLVDVNGYGCTADLDHPCAGCVFTHPGHPPLPRAGWREVSHRFLKAANTIVAPSFDVANRHTRVWPDLAITVVPPEDDDAFSKPLPRSGTPGRPPTIAVLGRLNVPKGFHVVLSLAGEITRSGSPVRLVLIGQSIDDKALRRAGVLVHGRYRPDEAPALLARYDPDVVFLPSIWPETWSFVLTAALQARLPVAAFDLGAPGERLRRLGFGTLLPLGLAHRPGELLTALAAIIAAGAAGTAETADPAPVRVPASCA